MDHATDSDLRMLEGLLRGAPLDEGSVTLHRRLAAALLDEVMKHRARRQQAEASAESRTIEISTILSSRTKEGMINLFVHGTDVQLDLPKAREVLAMLGASIEAAVSDQLIHRFLTEKIGLDDARAGRALLDFRELRQGLRGVVHPS